jgi:hypothetical protein
VLREVHHPISSTQLQARFPLAGHRNHHEVHISKFICGAAGVELVSMVCGRPQVCCQLVLKIFAIAHSFACSFCISSALWLPWMEIQSRVWQPLAFYFKPHSTARQNSCAGCNELPVQRRFPDKANREPLDNMVLRKRYVVTRCQRTAPRMDNATCGCSNSPEWLPH